MVLDMGAATTKLYVVEHGLIRASHIINRGGQDITLAISRSLGVTLQKAEEMKREFGLVNRPENLAALQSSSLILDHLFSEINRIAAGYQTKFNKNIARVVLTGGGSVLRGLKEKASASLEREVILADPFAKTDTPAFIEGVLKEVGPSFSVAVGLALRKLQELA
jgi:type IV pilus assembly protein PilM